MGSCSSARRVGRSSRQTWGQGLETGSAAAGLPGVNFHDLRHFTAEFVAAHGATEVEIMAWMGHSSPDMSRRFQRATADGAAALARLLSETVETARVTELLPRTHNRVK